MRKKLLFVIPEYSHGGTNKSLENLLHFIDKKKYAISILSLYEDGGKYYKDIFAPYIIRKSIIYYVLHDNRFTRKFMGVIMKILHNANFNWLYKYEINRIQNKYRFDNVIAFQENLATNVVAMLKTGKKTSWVQCDYKRISKNKGHEKDFNIYNSYNQICCVSETTRKSMQSVFPELSERIVCAYNTLNSDWIKSQSELDKDVYDKKYFNILSVGRFVGLKQFHLIPDIVKEIHTATKFKWYIIGSGDAKLNETIEKIKEYGLEDTVIIQEAVDNPYPYFAQANLHVCTSLSESFSYTIAEAKILHTPVLSNDFPVAFEVVDDDTGWICNIKKMAELLESIIENRNDCYKKKCESIKGFSYNNTEIIESLHKIL